MVAIRQRVFAVFYRASSYNECIAVTENDCAGRGQSVSVG